MDALHNPSIVRDRSVMDDLHNLRHRHAIIQKQTYTFRYGEALFQGMLI